jgi:hypothetical protein
VRWMERNLPQLPTRRDRVSITKVRGNCRKAVDDGPMAYIPSQNPPEWWIQGRHPDFVSCEEEKRDACRPSQLSLCEIRCQVASPSFFNFSSIRHVRF